MPGGGRYCCVYGCGNNQKHNPDKSFFSMPSDPKTLAVWLSLIQREDLLETSNSGRLNQRVCSDHFGGEKFKFTKKLIQNAVPHLKLPVSIQNEPESGEMMNSDNHIAINVFKCSLEAQTPLSLTTNTEAQAPLTKNTFLELCDQFLDEKMSNIVKSHVSLMDKYREKQQKKTSPERQKNTCDSCRKSWIWGRKTWAELIGRPDLARPNTKPRSHYVCCLHFEKSVIIHKPQLRPDALPTKLLPSLTTTSSTNTEPESKDVSTQTKFVYRCIQCDHKLCSACDVAGMHRSHYVLRVPMYSPKDKIEEVLRKIRKAISEISLFSPPPKNHEAVQAQLRADIGVQDVVGQQSDDQEIGDQEIGGQDIGDQHGQDIVGSDSIDYNASDYDQHLIEMPFDFNMEIKVEEHNPFEGIWDTPPEQLEYHVPRRPDVAPRLSSPSVAPSPSLSASAIGLSITEQTTDIPPGTYIREEPVASDELYTSDLSASQVDLNPVTIKNEPPDIDQPSTSAGESSQVDEYLVPSATSAKLVKVDSTAVPKTGGRKRKVLFEFEDDD